MTMYNYKNIPRFQKIEKLASLPVPRENINEAQVKGAEAITV